MKTKSIIIVGALIFGAIYLSKKVKKDTSTKDTSNNSEKLKAQYDELENAIRKINWYKSHTAKLDKVTIKKLDNYRIHLEWNNSGIQMHSKHILKLSPEVYKVICDQYKL